MNTEKKLIKRNSLAELVKRMNEEHRKVFAPVMKNDIIDFAGISSLSEMCNDYITTVQSAKFALFPKAETLFEIQSSRENVILKEKDINAISEIVLLGTRPCDAAGFDILTSLFSGDFKDNIFLARLKKTTVISISCNKFDSKCFCTSLNIFPCGTTGSDILLTKLDDELYLAEIITEKGKEIVSRYPDFFEQASEVDKEKYAVKVPVEFDLNIILEKIGKQFDSDMWTEQSMRCIGCGACAYVCPTCACFDIQDVKTGNDSLRKRSWDSCGFSLFTLHASGHNPREKQFQRWRQRVMHKFAYIPEQNRIIGCVGCGRCSRACSSDMNLKEHLINIAKKLKDE